MYEFFNGLKANYLLTAIVFIGVFLIYDGISNIWIISRVSRTAKAVKETMEALNVEAEIISEEEE